METLLKKTGNTKKGVRPANLNQKRVEGGSSFQLYDRRPETIEQRKLQHIVDNSSQTKQLKGYQTIANNGLKTKDAYQMAMASGASTANQQLIQRATEVSHRSINQSYKKGNSKKNATGTQPMGVFMEAVLDPWNPLHGTESSAFNRHGLYNDPNYSEKTKKGTKGVTALHLLNANLGGLAVDENLFPGHTNKNGQHLKSGETEVKNKVLTLLERGLKGYRVLYKVRFTPPPLLTPENLDDVPLKLIHYFINPKDKPCLGETNVHKDPNEELMAKGWTQNTSKKVKRVDKEFFDEENETSYTERVMHAKDPDTDAIRRHTHVADEDRAIFSRLDSQIDKDSQII